ncbi:hypothetical protein [Dactylosporangium sp. CA-233914]|uniref:hypothetical protein n=1 Tax=Dactylosporangium sp. CA-233914 TaxID=3239934 RepID=UPI003D8AA5F2
MRIRTGLALGLLLVLAAAGCARGTGDEGVASAGGATPAASSSGQGNTGPRNPQADQEQFLKFAQCMRDHGVPMEDPQFDGGAVSLAIPEGTDKSKVDAAQAECKQYMPGGGEPPKLDPADQEKLRKFSQCMRDNGIASFPDPSEDGGIRFNGEGGVDPKSEQFKAAQKACEQYQPKPPGGGEAGEGTTQKHSSGGGA